MVAYRRAKVPGGTYFFTLALQDRRSSLLVDHVEALGLAFRNVRLARSFDVRAIVVLPDHLHTVWTLPPGDSDFPGRWKAIKSAFTRLVKQRGVEVVANARNEHALWQRRYWEHLIIDDTDYTRHVDYIHANPAKHGFVRDPDAWPWSSLHRYLRLGLLEPNWMKADDILASIGAID